jgi:phosphoserine phosphatase
MATEPASRARSATGPASGAAFFRLEGTLVPDGIVSAAAYFAAHRQGMRARGLSLGQVALTAPLYRVLGQSDRVLANRLVYLALRHMSEDRIAELAEEYVRDVLMDRLLEGGRALLQKARRARQRVVIISDGIEPIVKPLIDELRYVDDYVCNHLEVRDGEATGALIEPVVGGHDSARWARQYAQDHGIDLSQSVAYAAHGPDLLMLTAVGQPCAVNPDFTLRRAARDAGWAMMDYDT